MVFYNLFTLLSLPAEVLRIQTLVIQLLLDEQLEVTHTQQQQKQPKISKSLRDGHLMPPPRGKSVSLPQTLPDYLMYSLLCCSDGAADGAPPLSCKPLIEI